MNETQKLPARIKTIWRLSAGGSLIFGLIVSALLMLPHVFWNFPLWIAYIGLGLTLVWTVVELALVPYRYAFSGYRITNTAVEMSSGFIFKKHIAIPIARIQNVTLEAGPLMQWQKLEQVVIATAATSHDIEGVEPEVAAKLRDRIMKRAIEVQDDEF
jgi:membrane protein YdbS with pleckstrin-like domain